MANAIKITIDWVRHAESCANIELKHISDSNLYLDRPLGYDRFDGDPKLKGPFQPPIPKLISYEPDLSFVGIQQAILLGANYLRNQSYDIIFSSPKRRTVQTGLLALRNEPSVTIFSIPFINETPMGSILSLDKENYPLRSDDLKEMVANFKRWLQTNRIERFDDIEVMTTLIKIRNKLGTSTEMPPNSLIKLINQILDCKPSLNKINGDDDSKYQRCHNNIKKSIQQICHLLSENPDPEVKVMGFKLDYLLKNLEGPNVDFSLLDYFQNDKTYDPEKFYSKIIPIIPNQKSSLKILCISHGNFLKHIADKYYSKLIDPKNTQVFRETISYDPSTQTSKRINFEMVYDPISIRQQFQNFEDLNLNICKLNELNGGAHHKYLKYKKKYYELKLSSSKT